MHKSNKFKSFAFNIRDAAPKIHLITYSSFTKLQLIEILYNIQMENKQLKETKLPRLYRFLKLIGL